MVDKKELLFELKNYIKYFDLEDLKEILNNCVNIINSNSMLRFKFNKNIELTMWKDNGDQYWYKDDELHRDNNKYAVFYPSVRCKEWWEYDTKLNEEYY